MSRRGGWLVGGVVFVVVVGLLVGLIVLPGLGGPGESRNADAAEDPVVLDVSPDEPFSVELEGVATIRGDVGSVTREGQITLRSTPTANGGTPWGTAVVVGAGVEVTISDTELAKDLEVTFSPTTRPASDSLPVAGHRSDDDRWELLDATTDEHGQITIRTREFSSWVPGWLDPGKIKETMGSAITGARDQIVGVLDSVTDSLIGRTDPDPCDGGGPEWASLDKQTTLVHTCLTTNTADGRVRAETQLKSNRRFFTRVTVPKNADYVWVDDSTAGTLGRLANQYLPLAATGDREFLLFPQGKMTAGYLQPDSDLDGRFVVAADHWTMAYSLSWSVFTQFAPSHSAAGWGALLSMLTCSDSVPSNLADTDGWWAYFRCIVTDGIAGLDDPGKALATAEDLLGDVPANNVKDAGRTLGPAVSKLRLLGKAVKVAGLAFLVRDIFQQIPDAFSQMGADRTGDINLNLTGTALRETPSELDILDGQIYVYTMDGHYLLIRVDNGRHVSVAFTSGTVFGCFSGDRNGDHYTGQETPIGSDLAEDSQTDVRLSTLNGGQELVYEYLESNVSTTWSRVQVDVDSQNDWVPDGYSTRGKTPREIIDHC